MVNIILLMIVANHYDFSPEEISTVAVLLVGYTGLLYLFKVCIPFTWPRTALHVAVCSGFAISVLFLRSWFSLLPLSWRIMEVTLPLAGIATGVLLFLLLMVEKVLVKKGKMEPQK